MTKLNLNLKWISKERGTQDADLYIRTQGPNGGSNGTFDPENNFAVVYEQCCDLTTRDKLLAISKFKLHRYMEISTVDGYTVMVSNFTVPDMSIIPELTADNAYEIYISTRIDEVTAGGQIEYMKWKLAYWNKYFNVTPTVTIEE
jgi:hypothetical protein